MTVYDGGPYYDYYDGPAVYRGVPRYGYSANLVVDVQHALSRRGYYRGPIDGQAGPGTRAAIRAFQIDRHLPVSGRIDGNVVRSLGLD